MRRSNKKLVLTTLCFLLNAAMPVFFEGYVSSALASTSSEDVEDTYGPSHIISRFEGKSFAKYAPIGSGNEEKVTIQGATKFYNDNGGNVIKLNDLLEKTSRITGNLGLNQTMDSLLQEVKTAILKTCSNNIVEAFNNWVKDISKLRSLDEEKDDKNADEYLKRLNTHYLDMLFFYDAGISCIQHAHGFAEIFKNYETVTNHKNLEKSTYDQTLENAKKELLEKMQTFTLNMHKDNLKGSGEQIEPLSEIGKNKSAMESDIINFIKELGNKSKKIVDYVDNENASVIRTLKDQFNNYFGPYTRAGMFGTVYTKVVRIMTTGHFYREGFSIDAIIKILGKYQENSQDEMIQTLQTTFKKLNNVKVVDSALLEILKIPNEPMVQQVVENKVSNEMIVENKVEIKENNVKSTAENLLVQNLNEQQKNSVNNEDEKKKNLVQSNQNKKN